MTPRVPSMSHVRRRCWVYGLNSLRLPRSLSRLSIVSLCSVGCTFERFRHSVFPTTCPARRPISVANGTSRDASSAGRGSAHLEETRLGLAIWEALHVLTLPRSQEWTGIVGVCDGPNASAEAGTESRGRDGAEATCRLWQPSARGGSRKIQQR